MNNRRKKYKRRRRNIQAREIKRRLLDLLGGSCEYCGYDKCAAALEFHHVDPKSKRFSISMNFHLPWEVLVGEANKCVIACANCHREVHFLH
jgi:5-methylcytosine-specific restriction endonuclease McrA